MSAPRRAGPGRAGCSSRPPARHRLLRLAAASRTAARRVIAITGTAAHVRVCRRHHGSATPARPPVGIVLHAVPSCSSSSLGAHTGARALARPRLPPPHSDGGAADGAPRPRRPRGLTAEPRALTRSTPRRLLRARPRRPGPLPALPRGARALAATAWPSRAGADGPRFVARRRATRRERLTHGRLRPLICPHARLGRPHLDTRPCRAV